MSPVKCLLDKGSLAEAEESLTEALELREVKAETASS